MTEEEINQAVKALLADLANGLCPHCHAKVEQETQVGRCVYAKPCGHRLYQGKAKSLPEPPRETNPLGLLCVECWSLCQLSQDGKRWECPCGHE